MNQASGLVKSFFNIIVSFHICSESSISVRRAYFMAVFDRRLTPHATRNEEPRDTKGADKIRSNVPD